MRQLMSEQGALFPIAILLLFIVSAFCMTFAVSYLSQVSTLNSLESLNVRATIKILRQIEG